MPRKTGDWLDDYLSYTENTEPPRSYHLWVGISVVAAVMQRKCWMTFNISPLHPNLFVILVGPSGRARKGTAMSYGVDLLRKIPSIKLVAQKVTEQQLIKDLQDSMDSYINPVNNSPVYHSSMTVFSGELAVFLGTGNIDFLALLTNIYDSEDQWEYRTKTKGINVIKGVCLNFLGGTAPDWIQGMIPRAAIGGGFTSRVIFVVEREMRKAVADPTPTPRELKMRDNLKHDLEKIHTLRGEFKFMDDAFEMYSDWYINQTANPPIESQQFDGYCSRRATHARKLSMILSACRGDDMLIMREDLERAINILEATEKTMPKAFSGLGKARYSELTEAVMQYLVNLPNPIIKHSAILRHFFPDIDEYTLNIVIETLTKMQVIKLASTDMSGTGEKTYAVIDRSM
jgi:hypothetical protein